MSWPSATISGAPDARYVPRGLNILTHIFHDLFQDVVERVETCGDCSKGIPRVQCSNPERRFEYFRSFSCKGFYPQGGHLHRLCPSCSQ
jgi:hypothetical protein